MLRELSIIPWLYQAVLLSLLHDVDPLHLAMNRIVITAEALTVLIAIEPAVGPHPTIINPHITKLRLLQENGESNRAGTNLRTSHRPVAEESPAG